MRYIALLRAVNVGGHNRVKMQPFCEVLEKKGLKNVSSYKASGNIVFDSTKNKASVQKIVKQVLEELLKKEMEVFICTKAELAAVVKAELFKKVKDSTRFYVTFTHTPLLCKTPHTSKEKGIVILGLVGSAAFMVSYPTPDGFGDPNGYVQKSFKIPATTRNWATVNGVLEAC